MILTYYCIITMIIIAYLLGSIPSAVWIGKKYYGIDMREHGSITSREAMYDYGIGRASGRVFDLRKRGYDVETTMETGLNRYGIPTRYARYTLHEGR